MTPTERFALADLANTLSQHLEQEDLDAHVYYLQDVLESGKGIRVYASVYEVDPDAR